MAQHQEVFVACFRLLAVLAQKQPWNQDEIGARGGVKAVCAVVILFPFDDHHQVVSEQSNTPVAKDGSARAAPKRKKPEAKGGKDIITHGSWALMNLCSKHRENRLRFYHAGGVEALLDSLADALEAHRDHIALDTQRAEQAAKQGSASRETVTKSSQALQVMAYVSGCLGSVAEDCPETCRAIFVSEPQSRRKRVAERKTRLRNQASHVDSFSAITNSTSPAFATAQQQTVASSAEPQQLDRNSADTLGHGLLIEVLLVDEIITNDPATISNICVCLAHLACKQPSARSCFLSRHFHSLSLSGKSEGLFPVLLRALALHSGDEDAVEECNPLKKCGPRRPPNFVVLTNICRCLAVLSTVRVLCHGFLGPRQHRRGRQRFPRNGGFR